MIPDLVIFDCDGVIVDSEGPTCDAIAKNLTGFGFPLDKAGVHELFVGQTLHDIHRAGRERGLALPDNWVSDLYAEMFEVLGQGVPLSDGVIDLFDALEAQGTRIAIASNGAIDKMRVTLSPYGLFDRLKDRMYSGHFQEPKPKAGMLVAAMKQANALPERTFMIDDSTAGAGAAVAAGTQFIGYSEHGGADKLEPLGVDIAYSMADLRARLVK